MTFVSAPAAARRISASDVIAIAIFAIFAVLPVFAKLGAESYLLSLSTRIMILGLAAVSLDFIVGFGGLVSFGQAAFVGLGAYAAGILAFHGIGDAVFALPAAILLSTLFALATGIVCLRTSGVYFIMITLAFSQMAFFTASSLSLYGGDDGLTIHARNTVAGLPLMRSDTALYYVVFACLGCGYLLCRAFVASRFGRVLRGARQNPARMATLGYEVFRYQLVAYAISGALAGVAGFLLANATEFVSPAYMSWQRSGELIIMIMLGGLGTLYGAIIGAAAFVLSEEWLSGLTEHWKMIFGPLLIVIVLFARGGLTGLVSSLAGCAVVEPVLRLESLRKNFGGLVVTDDVTLDVLPGELHAIIGPNGAGKTTLIHQICGTLAPDSGRLLFAGQDITHLPVHARAACGIARSFQITSILPDFSALENVALAVQARTGSSYRFFGRVGNEQALNVPAMAALEQVGLDARANVRASHLSHGERRALELAIALAMEPKLLLLDEPMAGTSAQESERLIAVLQRLKGKFPILLIEHDMTAVFALADRISVLIYGRILASGSPDRVRADPQVVAAYLGESME